jgi:hypothetical protein
MCLFCMYLSHVVVTSLLYSLASSVTVASFGARFCTIVSPHIMKSLHEIDARISALERELLSLKTRRNTFVPLCRLPVELLVKVLLKLCSWKELVTINSLCRSFKELTEGEPILWSIPPLAHQGASDQLAELFIRRSGEVPLTFFNEQPLYKNSRTYSARQLGIIAPQLERTKKLIAVVNCGTSHHFMESLRTRSINRMEELELKQNGYRGPHLAIESDFCGGHPHRLTSLSLTNIRLCGLPNFPSLHTLGLRHIFCTQKVLGNVLSSINRIRHLSIHRIELEYDDDDRFKTVDLPRLQDLKLHSDALRIPALMDFLPDPQASLDIRLFQSHLMMDHPEALKAISRASHFWKAATGQSTFEYERCTSWVSPVGVRTGNKHEIQFGRDPDPSLWESMPKVTVFFNTKILPTKDTWLPYMSQITNLVINLDIVPGHSRQAYEHINLNMLYGVKDLSFLNEIDGPGSVDYDWRSHGVLEELYSWILDRQAAGTQLATIIFQRCTPHLRQFFEELRDSRAASQVLWKAQDESDTEHWENEEYIE